MDESNAEPREGDLPPLAAARLVKTLAGRSACVYFTEHAIARMNERGISNRQVIACLTAGKLTDGPHRNNEGKLVMNFERVTTDLALRVVAALDGNHERGQHLIVITAISLD